MPIPSPAPHVQMAGHLLVECLVRQGVTHVFGVPGESYLAALDGFHQHREHIRFITSRHEGGAAFMAEAAGKLTGRPGVCFVTRGPGATNASIAVHVAFQDSTPMVLFVGDVPRNQRDREAFQELDFAAFFGPNTRGMAKRVERIDDPDRIPEYVARAFATALNGRPGPVVLVLPEDMLLCSTPSRPLSRVDPAPAGFPPEAADVLRGLLLQSRKPFVIVGGPGWNPRAGQALERFAEAWRLPIGNAFRFQDCFDNHHPGYAGDVGLGINPSLARRIQEADLVLALGARLGDATTGGYTLLDTPRPRQKLVHVHAGSEELNRVYQADLAVNASLDAAALTLARMEAPDVLPWVAWTAAAHADYLKNLDVPAASASVEMPTIIGLLQRHLPADAVLTNGAGNFASWLHRYFRYHGWAKGYRTQLAPTAGAMGYGVPAGVAASLLTGRTVVTFAGDGDFQMNGQELATAVQFGARTIVVLVNNGMLGTIRMHQEREFPDRVSSTDLANPDFVALGHAYGYAATRVTRTEEFEPALLAALDRSQGSLIEVVLHPEQISTRATLSEIRGAAHRPAIQERREQAPAPGTDTALHG